MLASTIENGIAIDNTIRNFITLLFALGKLSLASVIMELLFIVKSFLDGLIN